MKKKFIKWITWHIFTPINNIWFWLECQYKYQRQDDRIAQTMLNYGLKKYHTTIQEIQKVDPKGYIPIYDRRGNLETYIPFYQYYTMTSKEHIKWKKKCIRFLRRKVLFFNTYSKEALDKEFAQFDLMYGFKIKD